MYFVWWWEYFV